jgi:hypothetical protein
MVFSGVRAVIARQIRRIGARSRTTATAASAPGPAIPTSASAPTPQGETVFPYPSVVDLVPSIMVYSYAAPFETGKLNVSDVHSLQSVSGPPFFLFFPVVLWRVFDEDDSYEVSGNKDGAPGASVFFGFCARPPLVCRR